jgi:hypothetical protein
MSIELSKYLSTTRGKSMMALSAVIVSGSLVTAVALADTGSNSVQSQIDAILNNLHKASLNAMTSGQTTNTPQGKVFTGSTATEMNQLHDSAQKQIDELIARPQNERAAAVSKIKDFAGNASLNVTYQQTSKSSYNRTIPAELYFAGLDQYEVDARNNAIIQYGPRMTGPNEAQKTFDTTPRYDKEQLEAKAREFIAKQTNADIGSLAATSTSKNGVNYFFRWEDKSHVIEEMPAFIQVGYTVGGDLLSYTNTLGL